MRAHPDCRPDEILAGFADAAGLEELTPGKTRINTKAEPNGMYAWFVKRALVEAKLEEEKQRKPKPFRALMIPLQRMLEGVW